MNPYGINGLPADLWADLDDFNAGVERARAAADPEVNDYGLDCKTGRCTAEATCWRCRKRAELLLEAATNEAECAALIAVLDKGPRQREQTAKCGTLSGYAAHRRKGERPCAQCRDTENAYQRARLAARRGGAS